LSFTKKIIKAKIKYINSLGGGDLLGLVSNYKKGIGRVMDHFLLLKKQSTQKSKGIFIKNTHGFLYYFLVALFHHESAVELTLKISGMSKNLIIGFFVTGQSVE